MHARDQSSIFSTGGKFRPDYGLLLTLTLVARSYVLLLYDILSIYLLFLPKGSLQEQGRDSGG